MIPMGYCLAMARARDARHPYLSLHRPLAIAHRGGAGVHPENTERAFRHAVGLGFTHLETDVHVTSDGVAVAFHDEALDRVTDRGGLIAELTWSEVRKARVNGTDPICRLEDLLGDFPDSYFNLDPKHDAAVGPLADALTRTASVDRVCVGSFSDRRIDRVRKLVGEDLCVGMGPRKTLILMMRSMHIPLRLAHADVAQMPVKAAGIPIITDRFVKAAHRLGIDVHVWTINDAAEIERLLDLGVDGIMTDQPDLLKSTYVKRGVWTDSAG